MLGACKGSLCSPGAPWFDAEIIARDLFFGECMPLSEILLQLFPTLPYKWHGAPGHIAFTAKCRKNEAPLVKCSPSGQKKKLVGFPLTRSTLFLADLGFFFFFFLPFPTLWTYVLLLNTFGIS